MSGNVKQEHVALENMDVLGVVILKNALVSIHQFYTLIHKLQRNGIQLKMLNYFHKILEQDQVKKYGGNAQIHANLGAYMNGMYQLKKDVGAMDVHIVVVQKNKCVSICQYNTHIP